MAIVAPHSSVRSCNLGVFWDACYGPVRRVLAHEPGVQYVALLRETLDGCLCMGANINISSDCTLLLYHM